MAIRLHESAARPPSAERVSLEPPRQEHTVHFYENDDALCELVAAFIAEGLEAGEPLVVITGAERRRRLEQRLESRGLDERGTRRLTWFDSGDTLGRFMIDGAPDRALFEQTVGEALALAASSHPGARVRAYGDMVDVLWREDQRQAALRLEELWSELQQELSFTLLCAYSMAGFVEMPAELSQVCARHDRIHGETRGPLLEAELAHRREVECALRDALRELRETEAGLASSKRRLQTIIDALPALVAYVDADRRYRFCNGAYERWFGLRQADIEGEHIREVLGEAAYDAIRERVDRALAGHSVTFETRIPYATVGQRWVEASYVPERGPDGSVQGYVALIADITARKELEASRDTTRRRTERLEAITAAIANAITADQVFTAIVDNVAEIIEASSAGLWLVRDEGKTAVLMHSNGYAEAARAALASLSVDGPAHLPVLDTIRQRQAIWIDSRAELVERYPQVASMVSPGRQYRVAVLPISTGDALLGALGFTFEGDAPIDPELRAVLTLVVHYSSQALQRLRLLEAEATSRARAEGLAKRAALLSAASRAFSEAGPDVTKVLQTVVEQLTVSYADACGVALRQPDSDVLELAALHHRDPELDEALRRLIRSIPPTVGRGLAGRVAVTGEPILVPLLTRDAFSQIPAPPEHVAFAERLLPLSLVVVPLRARGTIIGTLSALRDGVERPFGADDLALLQDLADRAALAIEGGRLYEETERDRARAELLYGLTRTVIGADRREEVFEAALDAIARGLRARRSAILVYDAHGVMRFRAWRGLSDDYRQAVEGHSPLPPDVRAPDPVLVPDVNDDAALAAYRPLFEREGIGALGFFPLTSGERLLGKFMVYYERPRRLAAHEVDLAQAIANHVAAAVGRFAAVEDLQQTVRFNEMFTGVLGHDLRNPLAAITTAAQAAMLRNDNEALAKPLSRIMSSGHRMARMIEQLLDFTRLRVGTGIPLSPEPFDVVTLIRQSMDELEDAHPQWTVQLHQVGDTMGAWDPDRLSQVFSNLLANAIQHGVVDHGVHVRVDGQASDHIHVEITNMGTVPRPLLPRLFEPLAGGQRRRDGSRGLGLGLYITREIVHAHGGEIDVHSSSEGGTTITVSLPRAL